VIGTHVFQGALRHARVKRILGILHHRDAAVAPYSGETHGSVAQRAGKHHADHPWAMVARRGAEQHVHGRPVVFFLRSHTLIQAILPYEQVTVRRRNVNPPGLDALPVDRMGSGE
jgi:hypothetical protein